MLTLKRSKIVAVLSLSAFFLIGFYHSTKAFSLSFLDVKYSKTTNYDLPTKKYKAYKMALIIYPADNWDSFATEPQITALIESHVHSEEWDLLTVSQREIYLRQSTKLIASCPNITLPETPELDLQIAEAFMSVHIMNNSVTDYDLNDRAITSEKVDSIKVTYDPNLKSSSNLSITPMAALYLNQYGCTVKRGGFSQAYVGRS